MRTGLLVATCIACWASCVIAGPTVTVTRLDGSSVAGELVKLTADQIQLRTDGAEETLPTENVMQVEFSSTESASSPKSLTIRLLDQSLLEVSAVTSDGTTSTLTTSGLGEIAIPARQIQSARLAPLESAVEGSWQDLMSRNTRDDLLIIRKGDVLDYVSGSVGKISPEAVTMLVRGKELSAPRDRIFGIVYASLPPVAGKKIALRTTTGDLLQADSVSLEGDSLQVRTASLGDRTVPLNSLLNLDFGGGRIRFLGDLNVDARDSKSPSAEHPVVWFFSKNSPAGSGGRGALRIGQKEYQRGLWLHSGAVLRYRLNRDYTRLKAIAGFERTYVTRMPQFDPKVQLIIQGDQKELFRKEFGWNDPPVPLDLDLTDVRDLTIRVESLGKATGILEHFGLGDAQVIQ